MVHASDGRAGVTRGDEVSPASGAPFLQMRALRAQGGVVAVPGVNPRLIGQPSEDALFEAGYEAVESLRGCCPPRAAGEQAATGALAGRRWRAVALLASVVSSLTSANGLGGARGQCSPVTRGSAPGGSAYGVHLSSRSVNGGAVRCWACCPSSACDRIHVAATVPTGLDRAGAIPSADFRAGGSAQPCCVIAVAADR
jgi:hypothetical protein